MRPLRRCTFTFLAGYSAAALYFNVVDGFFESPNPKQKSKKDTSDEELRVILRSCLHEAPTVGAVALTWLVSSHGVLSITGATLAVLLYRKNEVVNARRRMAEAGCKAWRGVNCPW
eukprot:CAMPEP_0201521952 /NCGR_PEP_ID=MMETSP0161_2-20130828/16373_1 /ASSEMBLY_ACC=CAM_ASM_000251 /TAXON_ID=180227 /ORGANISM="Neoparamoeba aestuarina, Strain SoJaBio B1-5/56/2" /LENGTH=115 /DNA_ID=CAMNT_0047920693 /DNA_START=47 /DNA_END=391 /DNA_ORIENTATION=-